MDGVLVIDKPAGVTSHDVVAIVRRLLRERRVAVLQALSCAPLACLACQRRPRSVRKHRVRDDG